MIILSMVMCLAFTKDNEQNAYLVFYNNKLDEFKDLQDQLLVTIKTSDLKQAKDIKKIKAQINVSRQYLKVIDIWLRYLEPVSYKRINGPLSIEWETEVFEKFERPYKREGAGLTLAALYLDEEKIDKDVLTELIASSLRSAEVYKADSITDNLRSYHHFYLCNRLYLLNLATIYTTGFECPDTMQIIPELNTMLSGVYELYTVFNQNFIETPLPQNYLELYKSTIQFVNGQSRNSKQFDHFSFIKEYINPLFAINQEMLRKYEVMSKSNMDYSLNKNVNSIFNKSLYYGQNPKGIFLRVSDKKVLSEIENVGKLLFYDPILSGNNKRSCGSCHKATEYFTDTTVTTALQFNRKDRLPRNTPTLVNAQYNHLVMLDGKHYSLQHQTKAVVTNAIELGANEAEVVKKVMSCKEYKNTFEQLLKYTPQVYYGKFSKYYSSFDNAMNKAEELSASVKKGFNIYMSKAQCATCHFAPQFNGVKPPYIGSEFEVLGVPKDTKYKALSDDKGRYEVIPATETLHAFRTGTIRNAEKTKPYMHNGVFKSLEQVIDFYDAGGGAGHKLKVDNQTLSSDSLHLTKEEKKDLLAFIHSLNENVEFEPLPEKLPESKIKELNKRRVNGEY